MHAGIILLVFSVIFVSELPDKSLFATLILSTRYHSFTVWLGAATAFFIHVLIAVTLGHFLTFLPHNVLEIIIATLFFIGAAIILTGKHGVEEKRKLKVKHKDVSHSKWLVFGTAFSVIFIGEWGDITQIVTANYAAKFHDPLSVAIGATLGLWVVAGLAVIVGTRALSIIPPRILQRITAIILIAFGIGSIISIF